VLLTAALVVACIADTSGPVGGANTLGPSTDGSSGTTDDDSASGASETSNGSTPGSSGEQETTTDDVPVECDAPEVACGSTCVDTATDPVNCGNCGVTCVIPNAIAQCAAGGCAIGTCDDGWADCDGELGNGCETMSTCQEGGQCQTACGSTGSIICGQNCEESCAVPAETCNAVDDDCNEVCDDGLLDCRVGVHRSLGATLGHFYTTDLTEAMSNGLTVESQDYFYLYAAQAGALQPFFRCMKPSGRRFYTTSNDCEGTGAPELTVGFIAASEVCGSAPLHRLYNGSNDDHFYTTSAAERDNAVTEFGYVSEFIAGYIWLAP
jgi:hypothetical protein